MFQYQDHGPHHHPWSRSSQGEYLSLHERLWIPMRRMHQCGPFWSISWRTSRRPWQLSDEEYQSIWAVDWQLSINTINTVSQCGASGLVTFFSWSLSTHALAKCNLCTRITNYIFLPNFTIITPSDRSFLDIKYIRLLSNSCSINFEGTQVKNQLSILDMVWLNTTSLFHVKKTSTP